ncbi:ankyrin repeat domain-containing protein [Methylocystis rosea]|uniref:ankyrin repeat domain-containing protein n=1 Tax=Methylocystis rosea TaxID=173366 RepID=UPI001FDEF763|nr:ankyrin repeat domain-containing protein [Methylocystis rosea]
MTRSSGAAAPSRSCSWGYFNSIHADVSSALRWSDGITPQLTQWLTTQGFPTEGVNAVGVDGLTPLLRAAAEANVDALREIIAEGGDLHAMTRDGNNAVWLACKQDSVEVIELLSAAGANLHHRNPDGSTALIYAASAGKTAVVTLLLALGADPLQENVDGFSALDLASNIECLQVLRIASRQRRDRLKAEGMVET